jgi:hypothetical protein
LKGTAILNIDRCNLPTRQESERPSDRPKWHEGLKSLRSPVRLLKRCFSATPFLMSRRIVQFGVPIVLLYFGFVWATNPWFRIPGGLGGDGGVVSLIESVYPYHLIDPRWLVDNTMHSSSVWWCVAETVARLASFAVGTLMLFCFIRIRKMSGNMDGLRLSLTALFLQPAGSIASRVMQLINSNRKTDGNRLFSPLFRRFLLGAILVAVILAVLWLGLWNSVMLVVFLLGGRGLIHLLRMEMSECPASHRPNLPLLFLPALAGSASVAFLDSYLNGVSFQFPLSPVVRVSLLSGPCWFIFLAAGQFIALRLSQNRPGRLLLVYLAGVIAFTVATTVVFVVNDWDVTITELSGAKLGFFAKGWNEFEMAVYMISYPVRFILPPMAAVSVLLLWLNKIFTVGSIPPPRVPAAPQPSP